MVVAEAMLTHHPLVSVNWVSIGSGNGLWPVRRQAITLTNADLLWIDEVLYISSDGNVKGNAQAINFKGMFDKFICKCTVASPRPQCAHKVKHASKREPE